MVVTDFTIDTAIITVSIGEDLTEFQVIQAVLTQASPVVAQMFSNDCTEAASRRITLPQFEPDAFEKFLQLLHFQHWTRLEATPVLSEDEVVAVLPIALYLDTKQVKQRLLDWIEIHPSLAVLAAHDKMDSQGHAWSGNVCKAVLGEIFRRRSSVWVWWVWKRRI